MHSSDVGWIIPAGKDNFAYFRAGELMITTLWAENPLTGKIYVIKEINTALGS